MRSFIYDSPDVIKVVISRRMKWAWHVARMGQMRNVYKICFENMKGREFRRPRRRW
jgi:hypothetical protein